MPQPSGTVTFLFTDIEGSTQLWEHFPDHMKTSLARHDTLLREAIESRGGYVFKTVGDAFCAAFAGPAEALEATLAAHHALSDEQWPANLGGIRIRAALHTGVAEERDGDYFGPTLNRVARLLSAGHGGQTLITLATQELVRDCLPDKATLVDMGDHRLKDLSRSERIFQVNAPGLPSEFAPLKTLDARLTNLPAQPTPFVGRQQELVAVLDLLRRVEVRLVTLTGPGGTGKTRLSVQIGADLLDTFKEGVWFVSLAETVDHSLAVSKIAQVLGVREGSNQPLLESLKDYLHDKSLLLILDNFEQLVSAAPIVADLLTVAPRLKLLITSQRLLRVRGEHEFRVAPLALPDPAGLPSLDELQRNESIQFFVERAQSANPRFALTAENAYAIAEICHRLEGLPLAIELAAARIKVLSPQAMLGKLTDRLGMLTGGARDLPTRQQTLRNALDWSHSLLNEQEKKLFARVGIFVGGFSLDAAEAVCSPDGSFDVLGGIETLLNNSLLREEEGVNGQTRFRMLETIREYALEQLGRSEDLNLYKAAHAQYYFTKIARDIGFNLFTDQSIMWLDWLEAEHDNIRAALTWGQNAPISNDLINAILLVLGWFWYRRGYLTEGRGWADSFLKSNGAVPGTAERANQLMSAGMLALWQGDAKAALAMLAEGTEIMMRHEDDMMTPLALSSLGIVHINMGNDAAAIPLLMQCVEAVKDGPLVFFYAVSLVHLGNAALGSGRPAEAREWLDKAYPVAIRSGGDPWTVSFALNNRGEVARVQGDYTKARSYYEESEALLRSMGDHGDLARLVHNLGYIALHEGKPDKARAQFRESLAMFRKLGNKRGIAECVMAFSALKAVEGQHEDSARLFSAAETLLSDSGVAWWPADRSEVERTRATLQSVLGAAGLKAAFEAGQGLHLDDVFRLAQ